MTCIREQGAAHRGFGSGWCPFGAVLVTVLVTLSALADPPKPGETFAHKYIPSNAKMTSRPWRPCAGFSSGLQSCGSLPRATRLRSALS
jgi:hypothetical protein